MEKKPVILREWTNLGEIMSEEFFADEAAADAHIKKRKNFTIGHGGDEPYLSSFTKAFPDVVIGPDEKTS